VEARRAECETNDVVETIREVFGGYFYAIIREFLLDTGAPVFAGLGLERWIPNVAELIGVELIETRLLNSHSIKYAVTCVAPKARP